MAGGPSTPPLANAVTAAGGLGALALGYLTPEASAEQLAATRGPLLVNVFVPPRAPADPSSYLPYVDRLRAAGVAPLGQPRSDDDHYAAKIDLLCEHRPRAVSFTFGCPDADVIGRLHRAGVDVWVTVTTRDEAAAAAGADALVVQGAEAGGHRGGDGTIPLLPLLEATRAVTDLPLIATGGVATRDHVRAVLAAGAAAAQVGTAFLLAPEAGTARAHRDAVASDTPTALTRAFTGRLARGIVNRFMRDHDDRAPDAYPEIHHVTAPLRRRAREVGDADLVNLWAGTQHHLAVPRPAAETVRALSP